MYRQIFYLTCEKRVGWEHFVCLIHFNHVKYRVLVKNYYVKYIEWHEWVMSRAFFDVFLEYSTRFCYWFAYYIFIRLFISTSVPASIKWMGVLWNLRYELNRTCVIIALSFLDKSVWKTWKVLSVPDLQGLTRSVIFCKMVE